MQGKDLFVERKIVMAEEAPTADTKLRGRGRRDRAGGRRVVKWCRVRGREGVERKAGTSALSD